VVGLAGSLVLAKVLGSILQSVLFQVKPYDVTVFGGVAVMLLAVAMLACYVPARRATQIDPMVALRDN
jgi:ABC-type lipoprotein release transport system permease subunit